MTNLFITLVFGFGVSLILTPLIRAGAGRWGLIDHPDRHRKIHPRSVPVAGGVVILFAVTIALGATAVLTDFSRELLGISAFSLPGLLLAAVVICVIGVADDYRVIRIRHKLLGQLASIGIVMVSGVLVRNIQLFHWHIDLGPLAIPFTLFWLLGAINSLNLIDGMDGLLSSVGVIISLAMAAMALMGSQWVAAYVAVALAGALLGFLRYNFPPASIFLGDSGSMLVGLVIGVLAIQSSLKAPATIALAAPAVVLTIPILDSTAAIVRRRLTGRSIYTTDRGHLHHCLLHRGFSSRRVLLLVSFLCLVTVVGALLSLALRNELLAIVAAFVVVGVLVATRVFGYVEFLLVKERLLTTATSFLQGPTNGKAHQSEIRLAGTADWKQLWLAVTECVLPLNLKAVRLNVNAPALHEGYHAQWDCTAEDSSELSCWRAEIPLTVRGQILGRLEITGQRDQEPIWMKIATLAKVIQDSEVALAKIASLPGKGLAQNGDLPTATNGVRAGSIEHAS